MRAYLGFIPLAMSALPILVTVIRQLLFYQGCLDGYGFILIAMLAFIVGGLLNILFLLYVAVRGRSYFRFEQQFLVTTARWSFAASILLLLVQVVVLVSLNR